MRRITALVAVGLLLLVWTRMPMVAWLRGEIAPFGQRRQASAPVSPREKTEATIDGATLSIAYGDAYPGGFELEIEARTTVAWDDLARDGDGSGPDVFGRHWPMVGERTSMPREVAPAAAGG